MLNSTEFILGFDDDIFQAMVERINIKSIVKAEFVLKSGIPVEEIL
ncbi:MAG TPA: recombinase [Pseudobacteroides sp.]|nr:recombinase [Pseudobacteroides sp.]